MVALFLWYHFLFTRPLSPERSGNLGSMSKEGEFLDYPIDEARLGTVGRARGRSDGLHTAYLQRIGYNFVGFGQNISAGPERAGNTDFEFLVYRRPIFIMEH